MPWICSTRPSSTAHNSAGKAALDLAQMSNHRNSADLIIEALRRAQGVPRGQW